MNATSKAEERRFLGIARIAGFDERLALAAAGALLVLLAYFLPMFTQRITAATTRFSGGTTLERDFPVLVVGQHFAQAKEPKNEDLTDVSITVQPVQAHNGSGWGWLFQTIGQFQPALLSYLIVLLLPALLAFYSLGLAGWAYSKRRRVPESLIPITLNLALLGPIAMLLIWLHQSDFSSLLYSLADGALAPRVGFWGALLGTVMMAGAAWWLRGGTERRLFSWWALVFLAAFLIWFLTRIRPYPFLDIWNFIGDGIIVTLQMVITSFAFILLVSLLGGLGRISRSGIINGIASLYVEIIRGIPLLVQLLFIWFALPQVFDALGAALNALSPALVPVGQWFLDLQLSPFAAAVVGFTICYGAYGSEIFRAGISSIHHGQMEAARSLGMTYVQAMRYVILPQAVRVILPPLGNEFVALLKDSSLVSVLAVSDLTRRGREYMATTFLSFDTWILVALCYLVMTLFSARVVGIIESKSRFGR